MRQISVSDYLMEFLIKHDIHDIFGYQGGMVAHFFDSIGNYKDKIRFHFAANEQVAVLEACAYSQSTGKLGVVIVTSGPGFTNALTGIANAWFDSIPIICIAGQVNTKDKKRNLNVRQLGFQEIQSCKIASSITKKTYEIDDDSNVIELISDAYKIALSDRKGPVLFDFPINISRKIVDIDEVSESLIINKNISKNSYDDEIVKFLSAKKPIIIAGAGINQSNMRDKFKELVDCVKIPVITTMPAIDLLPTNSKYKVGYLGGTARREAGIILSKTDYVLAIGTRLCSKSIGYNLLRFAPNAKLIRVDIDETELERRLKADELQITENLVDFILNAINIASKKNCSHEDWVDICCKLKELLKSYDLTIGNDIVRVITEKLPSKANYLFDIGNNLIYGMQSAIIKNQTRVYISSGLGAMGYALPASIGVSLSGIKTYCFTGDGGAQMNIQALNTIVHEKLPVKIFIMNNKALGHIILFQDHYLDKRHIGTDERKNDYFSCNFVDIGNAYGIRSYNVDDIKEIEKYLDVLNDDKPALFQINYDNCDMLPNIHGGDNCITSGPQLPKDIIDSIKKIME